MRMLWNGEDCWHPATGVLVKRGEHDYPDEHGPALLALGLTAAEASAPPKRGRKASGEEE